MSLIATKRAFIALLGAIITLVLITACAAETVPATEALSEAPTAAPTTVPTSTPIPYGDFAEAVIPPADPERLALLTNMLSLIPEGFNSAVYLDLEFLRSNEALTDLVNPEVLGMDVALPSIATRLVNSIAVASDRQTQNLITPFQSNFPIGDMLKVAGGFGLDLGGGEPIPYEGHDVWDVNALGAVLAMATADATTGVAATGRGLIEEQARELAESSLDAFDGRSASINDAPGLAKLLADVPSGFSAAVLSGCTTFPLFNDIPEVPNCVGAVVSADLLPGGLVVFHSLVGFDEEGLASSAIEQTSTLLEKARQTHKFEDLGVRQEGNNLRVRVIVDIVKFADVYRLFTPSS